jgi:anti-sigma regulatory factor (Ser/Thr protein kinase)
MGPSSESRSWSRTLPAGPRTGAEARWFLSEALQGEDVDIDFDAARLLTTEVATNAARHGKEPIELSIELEEQDLRVSVFDHGEGFDPATLTGPTETGGRGISLVRELSSEWGVERKEDGTEVWFRI